MTQTKQAKKELHSEFSYNRLWKLLIDRNIKKKDLQEMSDVSAASIAKMGRCENVTTDVLLRICEALDCGPEDIMDERTRQRRNKPASADDEPPPQKVFLRGTHAWKYSTTPQTSSKRPAKDDPLRQQSVHRRRMLSIYAFQELKEQLESCEELRFLFTSPTFVAEKTPKERREFYIPRLQREKSLYGTEFEVRLRNELKQKAVARECANGCAARRSSGRTPPGTP